MKRETKLKYHQAQFIAAELILILEHMHSKGVAHRDLKPSNLLLDERLHLKLVDFGTAKFINESDEKKENREQLSPPAMQTEATDKSDFTVAMTNASELTTTPRRKGSMVGSEDYIAPEIIAGDYSGAPADLWSLGVILYLLLSGDSPFKGHKEQNTFQNILNIAYQFKDEEENFTAEAKDIIAKLLVKDPQERLQNCCSNTIKPEIGCYSKLRGHPFFEGIVFSDLLNKETPLDKKKFERQLLKEKILEVPRISMINSSSNPFGKMEESQDEDVIKKPIRERPKSALISKSEL